MNVKLSDYRYTRNLSRAYRAAIARQDLNPQPWREDGIVALRAELHRAMDWWSSRGQIRVCERAIG